MFADVVALLAWHIDSAYRLLRADVPPGPADHLVQASPGRILCSLPPQRGPGSEGYEIWRNN